jgi:hypothetical protein
MPTNGLQYKIVVVHNLHIVNVMGNELWDYGKIRMPESFLYVPSTTFYHVLLRILQPNY